MATVKTPLSSPDSGSYLDGVHVSLSCETANAIIYHSFNGGSTWILGHEIDLTSNVVITSKAVKVGMLDSAELVSSYIIVQSSSLGVSAPLIDLTGATSQLSAINTSLLTLIQKTEENTEKLVALETSNRLTINDILYDLVGLINNA